MTTGTFFKDMLSETSPDGKTHISSKRVMGTFVLIISQCCILYLTYRDGSNDVVENLLQTSMIMAASLLGISSITGIWKGNSVKIDKEIAQEQKMDQSKIQKCPYLEN